MNIEAMKQALETLEENHHLIEEHENPDYLALYDRRINALRTVIEAAEKQEPAYYLSHDGHLMTPSRAKFLGYPFDCLTALYTTPPAAQPAPVQEHVACSDERPCLPCYLDQGDCLVATPPAAQPSVPKGWRLVPVDALSRWRDAFAEEIDAWDINPPLHHIKNSHDEIDAMLSAATHVQEGN